MSDKFILAQGNELSNVDGVHQAYQINDKNILCNISSENLYETLSKLIKQLCEPLFFFMEIPSENTQGDNESKDVYYLDNCTTDVILAILKRYGDILLNDGVVECGFGSLKDNDEIYIMSYKVTSIYSEKIQNYSEILEKLNFPKENKIMTVWDKISDTNAASCTSVECEGENFYDVIENLKEVGMYFSHTTD